MKTPKLILAIAIMAAAGVFFSLAFAGSVSAADWVETFDTNVIASGEWIKAPVGSSSDQDTSYSIWGGKFSLETYESEMIYYYNGPAASSWANYEIVVPEIKTFINNFNEAGAGIVFRVQDKDNFYYAVLYNDDYYNFAGDEVRVGKCIDGICAPITGGTTAFSVNFNTSYRLKVRVTGDKIKVYVNDDNNPVVNVTDNTIFTAGSVGIFSGGLEVYAVTWDEFQVTFLRRISGHARDRDNNPVVGAVITMDSPALGTPIVPPPTDANSYYETYLSRGTYTVTGSHPSYSFVPQEVIIDNSDADVSFYTIFGYIRRYGTGTGINGQNVTISGGNYQPGFSATIPTVSNPQTGDPGYYEKQGVGNGTYTIQPANP